MAKVAVVTGANKGIGYHIARNLCRDLPAASTVYVGSRDAARGEAAVAKLRGEGFAGAELLQLDITDGGSVAAAAATLRKAHPDGVDILVNNAGFAFKNGVWATLSPRRLPLPHQLPATLAAAPESPGVQAKETLRVNYYGTLQTCEALLPLLRPNGRVVNVGSMAGGMSSWSSELRAEFLEPSLDVPRLSALCERFIADAEAGDHEAKGWPGTTYGMSKAAVHALTRIHAAQMKSAGNGITVNVCCPGWCKSDMAGWERPPKSAEEGADTPTWLALQEGEGAPTGLFFSDREQRGW